MNSQSHRLCYCQMFSPIIIIPLIQDSSLARPINFQWHLSKWSKWNDCFLSFVQCVRHYVTYVGSLPYLEPIIWWVGRQPTSGEIRVLKSIGGEKHGWCLHSIWQKWTVSLWMGRGEVALNGYSLQDPNKKIQKNTKNTKYKKNKHTAGETQHGKAGVTNLSPSWVD